MLLLARKPGQSITLALPDGSEVVVTVLDGSSCHLGIDAPRTDPDRPHRDHRRRRSRQHGGNRMMRTVGKRVE